MHLLLTSAGDITSDYLVDALPGIVLRLNWERWNEYSLDLSEDGFRIADQFNRQITQATLENIIWRKPLADIDPHSGDFWYAFKEFKYAIEAIIERVRSDSPGRLPIDPVRNATANKYKQLCVARRYMRVPPWRLTTAPGDLAGDGRTWITKSQTGKPIPGSEGFARVIYTQRVDPASLADGYPWFLQEAVDARFDLTIVFVDGRQFGFLLDRQSFGGMDWRKHIGSPAINTGWSAAEVPQSLQASIASIMADLKLEYGRVDLLVHDARCANAVFLEVNPNGQWAWLDEHRNNGLFEAMLKFLTGR